MKKVIYQQFGSVDQLRWVDVPMPTVGKNQVLVQVQAVSINPLDWKIFHGDMKAMTGKKFPKGVGIDFSGTIVEIGSQVSGFKRGDEVFGALDAMKGAGALSEYVLAAPTQLCLKPSSLSFEKAAALPVVGAAALTCAESVMQVKAHQDVLIHGASGGVGMILTQLCAKLGANVTAVVSDAGMPFASEWGATTVINYRRENILESSQRFDHVVDLSSKLTYPNARKVMKRHAIYVNPTPDLKDIIYCATFGRLQAQQPKALLSRTTKANLTALSQWFEQGLHIHIGRSYDFDDVVKAYQDISRQSILGKAVFYRKS